jgi:predicted nuclease of predicted toxin-antitoxin system
MLIFVWQTISPSSATTSRQLSVITPAQSLIPRCSTSRFESRVLITNDRDFGELVFVRRLPHPGVILFRLTATDLASLTARLAHVLAGYADQLSQFVVVTEDRVRVRRG